MSGRGKQNFFINRYKNKKIEEARKRASSKYINNYYKNEAKMEKILDKYDELDKTDIMYKLVRNLARRIWGKLDSLNIPKPDITYSELLGCTPIELKRHIRKQFKDGMKFSNYKLWELDHILPISSFNLIKISQLKKCCHYTNIQPLWMKENRSK